MTLPKLSDEELFRLADLTSDLLLEKMAKGRGGATAVPDRLLTKQELAGQLGVSYGQVDRYVKAGMPRTMLGKQSPRFDLAACRAWLARANDVTAPDSSPRSAAPATPPPARSDDEPIPGVRRLSRRGGR